MHLKITHVCKRWTEPHPPSQRSSCTQRVMPMGSSFPPGFSDHCTWSSGRHSRTPAWQHAWLPLYLAAEESCHFQTRWKFNRPCGRAQGHIRALPAIHFVDFWPKTCVLGGKSQMERGHPLTLNPVKLLRQCCRFGLCPVTEFAPGASGNKFLVTCTNGAEH